MENALCFEQNTFKKRVKSMLKVDFSRMIKSRLFYIIVACALAVPVVMAVMLTMMDGSVSVDPQTGKETVMDGPDYVWELIGDFPSEGDNTEASAGAGAGGMAAGGMDVLGMCNINLAFMGVAFLCVCLFRTTLKAVTQRTFLP